ncbi:hypothetical protein [Nocardioides bruguierae]|uniref:hypothetical protein n=1 Tax=Nocardioides bruguierae TaxID=2945102 RepID=UPI00202206C4|nr:hypothetical protein [Nocardioides bruguierae]MCL8024947.1 hypothetical protein [Nocardioides bruguierae]
MGKRVVLHVGLMKSGTTYLQSLMEANHQRLLDQGVLFPTPWAVQTRGVSEFLELPLQRFPGAWEKLRSRILEHEGDTVVISMEYLGPAKVEVIRRLREELPGCDVHAVITVRDLGRGIPAMWQETIKNRRSWGWSEYLEGIAAKGAKQPPAGAQFWRQQGFGRAVTRWAEALGKENVTVVTIPQPGAPQTVLWDRFREVAGITEDEFAPPSRSNTSLGLHSTLLMRLLNERTEDLTRDQYRHRYKALSKHTLGAHAREEAKLGFTVPGWLRRRTKNEVQLVRKSGVRVIGDLEELTPVDTPGVEPSDVDDAAVLDAAVHALDVILREGEDAFRPQGKRTHDGGTHPWDPAAGEKTGSDEG